jgi:iron-sulfur cluster repair protein YtfE (RIC family)
MLTTLKKKGTPVREPDAVDLLLDCHERIRRFTRMAEWLCHAHDAPGLAVQETAAAVHRYFTEALPLHSADEDGSIAPRLARSRAGAEALAAAAAMARQHGPIEETLAALRPMWRAVADDPAALADHAPAMERLVDRLKGLWDTHLHLEEVVVFPAARRYLSASEKASVLKEMRERRGQRG